MTSTTTIETSTRVVDKSVKVIHKCKVIFKVDNFGDELDNNCKQQLINNKTQVLTDNTLTVGFDITVYKTDDCNSGLIFDHLFGVRELTDCRLVVGKDKKEFFVSKLVLSARSEVFRKMFTTDCLEKKTNEVVIDDIDSNVFEQFLCYLYTGKCNKLDQMCEDLLLVADKYLVESFKTICLNCISMKININNAFKSLKILQDFGADKDIIEKSIKFISENITSVVGQEIGKQYGINLESISKIIDNIKK
ncbi:speckle-type POZ protein B-like [Oppia nitens]|uniref:speckle-type POZ protein B-like n=1 Tax=Oppia nitens TaxID=1686743 RepID=UPI0023DAC202|nr:speckle-type POZ protein B-like [Oppia nitens]